LQEEETREALFNFGSFADSHEFKEAKQRRKMFEEEEERNSLRQKEAEELERSAMALEELIGKLSKLGTK